MTVMPSTSELGTLFDKLNIIRREFSAARDPKDPNYGKDCSNVWDKTVITFGGTKPLNIMGLTCCIMGKDIWFHHFRLF